MSALQLAVAKDAIELMQASAFDASQSPANPPGLTAEQAVERVLDDLGDKADEIEEIAQAMYDAAIEETRP